MKKILSFILLGLMCSIGNLWAEDVVWDFSDRDATSFESNKSYSFLATDGSTEMRYSAGSSDAIIAKNGDTSGYLKENGKTGNATVKDIDQTTNLGKTRLIRLFVSGIGKLTINCNGTNGKYKVLDGATNGTTLISSLDANIESEDINVTNFLWIETSQKGYITSIIWSPSNSSLIPAGLSYESTSIEREISAANFTNALTNPNSLTVTYSITSNGTGSSINSTTGEVTVGAIAGTETITATFAGDETYAEGTATYTLIVKNPLVYKNDFTNGEIIWTTSDEIDDAVMDGWVVKGDQFDDTGTKDLRNKSLINPEDEDGDLIVKYTSTTNFDVVNTYAQNNDRSLLFYVTGVSQMNFYVWSNSSPDGRSFKVEVNGGEAQDLVFAQNDYNAKYIEISLNKASNNIIRVYATNQLELYAIKALTVTVDKYNVTYKANNGSAQEDVEVNTSKVGGCPDSFTWDNHVFVGWNTQANGLGTDYAEGDPVVEDITLYAQWQNLADVSGEIIRATHTGAKTADVIGLIGGSVDKNTQSGGKLGASDHYFGIRLATGTFLPGDVITIYASTPSTTVEIFGTKTFSSAADSIDYIDKGEFIGNYYTYELTSATEWIYLYRTKTAGSAMNPTLGYISVSRNPSFSRDVTAGNYGTICLPNAVAADAFKGATLYNIAGKHITGGVVDYIVLEEATGDLVAGRPYIFEANLNKIYAWYNGDADAAGNHHGLVGTLSAISVDAPYYLLADNTIVNAVAGSSLPANRAYIDMASVPEYNPSQAPGVRIVEIALNENNATDIQNIEGSEKAVKFIENGKLYIQKDGVVYDATGAKVR